MVSDFFDKEPIFAGGGGSKNPNLTIFFCGGGGGGGWVKGGRGGVSVRA